MLEWLSWGDALRQQHSMLLVAKAHKGCARSAEEPWALPTLISKTKYAGVAQLVEQLIRNQQVECSNHFSSTIITKDCAIVHSLFVCYR